MIILEYFHLATLLGNTKTHSATHNPACLAFPNKVRRHPAASPDVLTDQRVSAEAPGPRRLNPAVGLMGFSQINTWTKTSGSWSQDRGVEGRRPPPRGSCQDHLPAFGNAGVGRSISVSTAEKMFFFCLFVFLSRLHFPHLEKNLKNNDNGWQSKELFTLTSSEK